MIEHHRGGHGQNDVRCVGVEGTLPERNQQPASRALDRAPAVGEHDVREEGDTTERDETAETET